MRAKPHSSPLSFSNSTYLKLFVLLILLIAVVLVSAAVFVYYPASINASWVNPPVTFFNPGTSGVSVTLYDDNTRADIEVTSPGDLVLTQRNAFIWDDYYDDPFTGGRLYSNTPDFWSWDSQGFIRVSANGPAPDWGGERVAYYSDTPPPGTSVVYVLVKESHNITSLDQYVGIVMIESNNAFYTLDYRGSSFFTGPRIDIRRYRQNNWRTLSFSSLSLDNNVWYIFLGRRELTGPPGQRGISLTVYDNMGNSLGTVSGNDAQVSVSQFGIGIYDTYGILPFYLTAQFDDFIACADADPRYVNVTGLQNGWTVILKDSKGGTVDQKTAGSTGSVSLNVLTKPIIRSARFEIVLGDVVILNQSFPFDEPVVGGDVYECRIRDMNILGFHNYDSKDYNVYVRVESLQVPSGYSGSINLWVRVGTVGSTPIRIVGSNIQQGTTSPVMLGYGASGYIHGTFSLSPPPSTPVVLTLSFHYYIPSSEVEVEYPITVRIHS